MTLSGSFKKALWHNLPKRYYQTFIIGILSTIYRLYVPSFPLYGMVHDDELQVSLANNINQGLWLGPYEQLTHRIFAKGPGYPIFLAITSRFPWSPVVSVHVLLLFGAVLTLVMLVRLGMKEALFLPAFALIAFCPVWFGDQMSRIYRDGLLAALTFLAIALLLKFISEFVTSQNRTNKKLTLYKSIVPSGLMFGFVLSFWYITKPSLQPIYFAVITLAIPLLIRYRNVKAIVILSVFFICSVIGFLPITKYVESKNQNHYGVSQIENFYSGSFSQTLSLMTVIEPISTRRYVAISKYMRQNMYAASPTFQRLKPWLEANPGEGWRAQPCNSPLKICDESASHFQWELRDAAELAGLANSAVEFESTFKKIFTELTSACNSGQLRCSERNFMPAGAPIISQVPKRDVIESFFEGFQLIWNLSPATKGGSAYTPNVDTSTLKLWNETVHGLPVNSVNPEYKPGQNNAASSFSTLLKAYELIWHLLLLLSFIGMFFFIVSRRQKLSILAVISIAILISMFVAIEILGILEASIGLYISSGGSVYSISVFPFALTFVIAFCAELINRLPTNCSSR